MAGNSNRFIRGLALVLYYGFARHLPRSYTPYVGGLSRRIRYHICRHIFLKCGKNVNVEHGARFGTGRYIEIGDNSGIGVYADIPRNTVIGHDVMMGPNCYIAGTNHIFSDTDRPMIEQGMKPNDPTVIGNDVWIGANVSMTFGRHIADGSIIALGCVLTADFPPYSVVGGNPCRLLRTRLSGAVAEASSTDNEH